MTDFFKSIQPIKYEGPESTNEFSFRHYDPDEVLLGKRMEEHLRFAVAYPYAALLIGLALALAWALLSALYAPVPLSNAELVG